MKNLYLIKAIIITGAIIIGLSPCSAQVGFNNPAPDSSALIDMKANDKGLLIPRMTTTERTLMSNGGKHVAHALLVFDTDKNMFFVYDTIAEPDRWLALNPWTTEGNSNSDVQISTTGNVGINTPGAPTAKLDVNGDIKSNGRITSTTSNVSGNLSSGSVSTGSVSSTGPITSQGTITAQKFEGDGTVPPGAIVMWSGNPSTIPTGWALCNGQIVNGFQTPDLRGRFIAGYDPGDVDYNLVNKTGGEKQHALTVSEMPRHRHSYNDIYQGDKVVGRNAGEGENAASNAEMTSFVHTNYAGGDGSDSEGPGLPHENRPPYYVLAYIIKVP